MYPNPLKLSLIEGTLVLIDGNTIDGDFEIDLELESRAGVGDPQITFRIGGREVEVGLSPDAAQALSDALAFFARASQRIAARTRHERKAVATTARDDVEF